MTVEQLTAHHFRSAPRPVDAPQALPGAGHPVILIAGHLLFGQCMAEALVGAGFTVTLALLEDRPRALDAVAGAERPLVVLDLDTAGDTPLGELVTALRERRGRVVVLSSPSTQLAAADCIAAGAHTAVDKRGSIAPLVRTLLDLARRENRQQAQRGAVAAELLRLRDRELERLRPFASLTHAEQEVLAGLMDGLSTAEIADLRVVSSETVRSQVKAILRKLQVGSQLGAVALARSSGWLPGRPLA